jgi:hypothetical protein
VDLKFEISNPMRACSPRRKPIGIGNEILWIWRLAIHRGHRLASSVALLDSRGLIISWRRRVVYFFPTWMSSIIVLKVCSKARLETITTMSAKIKMRDGDAILVMVKDGRVIHFSPNMSLPHSEFVKRSTGELPAGAWVGTVSKLDGGVMAISSKHFFGYQLPGPPEVIEAIRNEFE